MNSIEKIIIKNQPNLNDDDYWNYIQKCIPLYIVAEREKISNNGTRLIYAK